MTKHPFIPRPAAAFFLALALLPAVAGAADPSVGMPAEIRQLVLPGPELVVGPIDELKTPLVVRILDVYPHGSSFRYNISYYGIKPGTYDLTTFLRRKDGLPAEGLPPAPVTISSVLPPGQVEPHKPEAPSPPAMGGYRDLLLYGAMAWSAGLVLVLYLTRRKPDESAGAASRPLTLADRLRPLAESAAAGTLGPGGRAELERLLIGYWRRRLGLEQTDPARALAALREHGEAGPVLRTLEDWLHRPGGASGVDVAELLRPYGDIPADDPAAAGALAGGPA